jgi:type II secretory pathway predicted ATPase ExeA
MFLGSYHLREQPFGVTPDPRYLYLSAGHREALASLVYGIETGRGFLSLIAEPGMGKTTILFQVLKRFFSHSAFLFQTQCNSREFLCYLLQDLGLENHDRDIVRMHSELNDFLYRESKAGNPVVVVIDEAQNLSDRVLETVRLLSDFEAPEKKLLQIVLAGQPGLARRLSHPGLAQLRQRISIQARLQPLSAVEVAGYIGHRLQVAGYRGSGLFTPDAVQLIAKLSGGIPRIINNLCFNALSIGCAMRREKIGSEVVREVAKELSLDANAARAPLSRQRLSEGFSSAFRTGRDASLSEMGGHLFRQRTFQISFLSAMLVSAIFFGFWSRATKQTTFASPGKASTVLATQELAPDAMKDAAGRLSEAQPDETRRSPARGTTSTVLATQELAPDAMKDAAGSLSEAQSDQTRQTTATPKASTVLATQELAPDAMKDAAGRLSEAQPDETRRSPARGTSAAFFTYVVEPHDTLRELCTAIMGQYDPSTLAQIRRLNPGMRNLNHLQVGQELRFPLKTRGKQRSTLKNGQPK